MPEKESKEPPDVKVHVLKDGLYADLDEIMNHPTTSKQLEDLQKIMELEEARRSGEQE